MHAQPATLAASGPPPHRQSVLRRVAPVAGLLVLAPLVGEYLLGNVSIVELPALPILALLYGSGAILVRELARRTGRGWPTMLGLGLAYGLLEAGPIDQTLFNPPGVADAGATYLPAVGLSAANALAFVVGHAVWSIGVPIAIVEALARGRRTTPWLGLVGLSVTGALYLLGAVLIFRYMQRTEQFLAPVPWRLGAAVVAAGLVGLAFALARKPRPPVERPAPGPRLVGLVAFAAATLFFLKSESWAGTAFGVAVAGATAALVARWSRRAGWGDRHRHRLALAGGALLTYAWGGFLLSFLLGRTDPIHYLGNAALAAAAVALLTATARRLRREHDGQTRGPPAGSGSGAGSVDGGDENSRTR